MLRSSKKDEPVIGHKLDAGKLSLDKAVSLDSSPYPMQAFIDDLVAGNIAISNVAVRRARVMRTMKEAGKQGTEAEFEIELHEQIALGAHGVKMLEHVNDDVLRALGLDSMSH